MEEAEQASDAQPQPQPQIAQILCPEQLEDCSASPSAPSSRWHCVGMQSSSLRRWLRAPSQCPAPAPCPASLKSLTCHSGSISFCVCASQAASPILWHTESAFEMNTCQVSRTWCTAGVESWGTCQRPPHWLCKETCAQALNKPSGGNLSEPGIWKVSLDLAVVSPSGS